MIIQSPTPTGAMATELAAAGTFSSTETAPSSAMARRGIGGSPATRLGTLMSPGPRRISGARERYPRPGGWRITSRKSRPRSKFGGCCCRCFCKTNQVVSLDTYLAVRVIITHASFSLAVYPCFFVFPESRGFSLDWVLSGSLHKRAF